MHDEFVCLCVCVIDNNDDDDDGDDNFLEFLSLVFLMQFPIQSPHHVFP